jgi:Na+-driven multidrug efflux pump
MRIDGIVMMPIFSFGNAMTVYAGQNMGAGKVDRIAQGTKQGIIMAVCTAVVLVSFILIFGEFIAASFTQTREVVEMSQRMIRIISPGFIVFSIAMVFWGAVRGAGDAISPMWASIINTLLIRIPSAYLFVHFLGRPEALMFSMLAAWTFNMILSLVIYRIGKWRTKGGNYFSHENTCLTL